jgi:hypothetical protein
LIDGSPSIGRRDFGQLIIPSFWTRRGPARRGGLTHHPDYYAEALRDPPEAPVGLFARSAGEDESNFFRDLDALARAAAFLSFCRPELRSLARREADGVHSGGFGTKSTPSTIISRSALRTGGPTRPSDRGRGRASRNALLPAGEFTRIFSGGASWGHAATTPFPRGRRAPGGALSRRDDRSDMRALGTRRAQFFLFWATPPSARSQNITPEDWGSFGKPSRAPAPPCWTFLRPTSWVGRIASDRALPTPTRSSRRTHSRFIVGSCSDCQTSASARGFPILSRRRRLARALFGGAVGPDPGRLAEISRRGRFCHRCRGSLYLGLLEVFLRAGSRPGSARAAGW